MRWILIIALCLPCAGAEHFSGTNGAGATFVTANVGSCAAGPCSTSVTLTLSANSLVVCSVAWNGGTFVSVTDNHSNTLSTAGSIFTNSLSQKIRLTYLANASSGSSTFTPNITGGGFITILCSNYTGVVTAVPALDQASGQTGTTTTPTCPAVTTGSDGELIVAAAVRDNGSSWAAGSGYTLRTSNLPGTQSGYEDKNQTSAGSVSGAFATDGLTTSWACVIATFKTGTPGDAHNASLRPGCCITADNLVVSFWMKSTAVGGVIMEFGGSTPGTSEMVIDVGVPSVGGAGTTCNNNPLMNFRYFGAGTGAAAMYSLTSVPNNGAWHHILASMAAGSAHVVYVDGVLGSLTNCSYGSIGFNGVGFGATFGHGDFGFGEFYWTGDLAEVGVWFVDQTTLTALVPAMARSLSAGMRLENLGDLPSATVSNPTPFSIFHFDCDGSPLATEPNYAVGPNRDQGAAQGGGYVPLSVSGTTCSTNTPPITNAGRF